MVNMDFIFLKNRHNLSAKIIDFLKIIDKDFTPFLSTKINFQDYVTKIILSSDALVCSINDEVIGLIVSYNNNFETKKRYISLLAILPYYRKKGIAKELLKRTFKVALNSNMNILGVHSNNENAIRLYQVLGFRIMSSDNNTPIRYYLEKKI
jgi:ribosomal protein S18 acetylase RimI-like enzyme